MKVILGERAIVIMVEQGLYLTIYYCTIVDGNIQIYDYDKQK